MNFLFIFDTKNNSFLHSLPEDKAKSLQPALAKIFQTWKWKEIEVEERKKLPLGDKRTSKKKLVGFKIRKYIFLGCIVNTEEKNREVYACLEQIQITTKEHRKLKGNKPIFEKMQLEHQNYLDGQYEDQITKTNKKIQQAQMKANNNIKLAKDMGEDLTELDEKTKQLKDKAKLASENAAAIHYEAFWLNQKWNILIYGTLSVIGLAVGLYIVRIFV